MYDEFDLWRGIHWLIHEIVINFKTTHNSKYLCVAWPRSLGSRPKHPL